MTQQTLTATAPSVDKSVEYQWLQPGQWTYDDYLQLPDDGKRYDTHRGHRVTQSYTE